MAGPTEGCYDDRGDENETVRQAAASVSPKETRNWNLYCKKSNMKFLDTDVTRPLASRGPEEIDGRLDMPKADGVEFVDIIL